MFFVVSIVDTWKEVIMIHGSINKISLSLSSFERVISEGKLYVDKTRMIENFLIVV